MTTIHNSAAEHSRNTQNGTLSAASVPPPLKGGGTEHSDGRSDTEARNTHQNRTLNFFVPGDAAPQGSKRHIGHGRMIESSTNLPSWRESVGWRAQHAMQKSGNIFTGAVAVRLDFILHRPKATPKRFTPPAIKRPDIDKLARACLDAITGVVITDDSLVVDLTARKRLAQIGETPGVRIQVSSDINEWLDVVA